MLNAVADPRERLLLEGTGDLFAWLGRLPAEEAALVREVVAIITGGQRLDLERFAAADGDNPVALEDDAALEDYAWRVAGCVGAFWTKLGFLPMDGRFSDAPEPVLLERGIAYGKGLQLVNILRDLHGGSGGWQVLSSGRGSARCGAPAGNSPPLGGAGDGLGGGGFRLCRNTAFQTAARRFGPAGDDRPRYFGTPARRGLGKFATTRQGAPFEGLPGLAAGLCGQNGGVINGLAQVWSAVARHRLG